MLDHYVVHRKPVSYSISTTIENQTNEQTLTTISKNYNYMGFKERFHNMLKGQAAVYS